MGIKTDRWRKSQLHSDAERDDAAQTGRCARRHVLAFRVALVAVG
jgi:hypothetical protein